MPEIDPLILKMMVDDAGYKASISRTTQLVQDKLGNQENSVRRLEKQYGTSMSKISGAMRGIGVALVASELAKVSQEFLALADESKKIAAQLQLATKESGSFAQAQKDVQKIAANTRGDLSATAALYGNFARNAKSLGINQGEVASATETVAKTFKISGAGAVETSQGIRQLVQALQSGVLRGDEFNTMMESSPRLAKLLADSLGVPISSLRTMAEAGDLTSDKLTKAFTDKRFTDGIDAEFKRLPVTFEEAMGQVHNAAVTTFGAFDRGGQFSTALANFITGGTKGFADLESAAEQFGSNTRAVFDGFASVFDPLLEAGRQAFAALGIEAVDFGDLLGNMIQGNLKRTQEILNFTASPLNYAFGSKQPFDFADRFAKGREDSKRKAASDKQERDVNKLTSGRDILGNPIGGGPADPKPTKAKTGKKGAKGAAGKSQEDIDAQYADELVREIMRTLSARHELATSIEDQAEFERRSLEHDLLQHKRDIAANKTYSDAKKAELTKQAEVTASYEREIIDRKEAEAKAKEAQDIAAGANRNAQELLKADEGLADTRAQRHAIELKLLDLVYEQQRAELQAVLDSQTASKAQKEIANARLGILDTLKARDKEGIDRQNEGPLDQYKRDIGNVGKNINDSLQQVEVDGLKALNDGLTDAIMNSKSLGDVFKNVAKSIIADLIRIAIQQTIVNSLTKALGSVFGGGGYTTPGYGSGGGAIPGASYAASGTNYSHGGVTRVGEAGPETIILPQGAKVIPAGLTRQLASPSSQQQTIIVQVQANDYFDAVVDQRAGNVAAPMAAQATMAGSQMTEARMMRRARNRIPG